MIMLFDDETLKNDITKKIHTIFSCLNRRDKSSLSLMSGEAGVLLFQANYSSYIKGHFDSNFIADLENLATRSMSLSNPTFCSGKNGIDWFFSYLYSNDWLELTALDVICNSKENRMQNCLKYFENNNYDYLHGALGVTYALIYSHNEPKSFYKKLLYELDRLMKLTPNYNAIPEFDLFTFSLNLNKVNLGLAHGLPSILKFLLLCYQKGIFKKKTKEMALKLIEFLLSNFDINEKSCFPSAVIFNEEFPRFSRLGWCYGDLTIAFILFQASNILKIEALKEISLRILLASTERKDYAETNVVDAGFCHGASGIAYIYYKIWKHTGEQKFSRACEYWTRKTLELAVFDEKEAGFRKFNGASNKFEFDTGLLEGISGIGLVFLELLYQKGDWDYAFMLNDI
jgi:lantibiotic biosynthesis protein